MSILIREITLNGRKIQYNLTYKSVKNINVRIKNNKEICVSANRMTTTASIDKMLTDNSSFILNALSKASVKENPVYHDGSVIYCLAQPLTLRVVDAQGYSVHQYDDELVVNTRSTDNSIVEKLVKKWYDEKINESFKMVEEAVKIRFAEYISFTPEFTYRYMKSIWGSCNKNKRKITINKNLIKYDKSLIEFVYCHEYSHLIFADHSKKFYDLLSTVLPDHKQRKDQLREVAAKY